jgi:hypothetical protein
MLRQTGKNFSIQPIIDQTLSLDFDKRISLNYTEGYLFSGPYIVKPEFINTPLGNLLTDLGSIGEARLMKLPPESTYMAHSDPDDRLHLAIVTNPYSYLIDLDNNSMYHLPVDGSVWLMDTGKRHVAANFGSRDRIHLNIRCTLPDVTLPFYHYKIIDGDFDYRHVIQANISTFLNIELKLKNITGIRKISEREIFLNFSNSDVKQRFEKLINDIGLNFEVL